MTELASSVWSKYISSSIVKGGESSISILSWQMGRLAMFESVSVFWFVKPL